MRTDCTLCSAVFIVDFEQVNAGWILPNFIKGYCPWFILLTEMTLKSKINLFVAWNQLHDDMKPDILNNTDFRKLVDF